MNDFEIDTSHFSPMLTRELIKHTMAKILEEDCMANPNDPYDKVLLFADEDSPEAHEHLPESGSGFYLVRDEYSNPFCYRAYVWRGSYIWCEDSWEYVDSLQGYQRLDDVVDLWYMHGGFTDEEG